MRRRQAPGKLRNSPGLAALMSALLPGLGQFYNRQLGKGWGFLVGAGFMAAVLISGFNTARPMKSSRDATVWDNQDLIFAVGPFLLGFIIWSAVDAFRTASRP